MNEQVSEREKKITQAIQAVRDGMPKLKAFKKFAIPRATIQFRMSDKFKKPGYGPTTYVTPEEEATLVEWINTCQRKGFPRRVEDIQHSVQNFIKSCDRKTAFPDGLPGKGWYRAFIKRHPELCLRTTEAVTQASSCISEGDIRNWFENIENELEREGHKHILNDPNRIFNGDETNFLLCPKNKKVIACRGTKNVYEVDKGVAKASLTVMFTFCANGDVTPPMVIYPYKRKPPKEILETVPYEWGIGYSDNGWMKASLFYEYVANVFNLYLEEKKIEKPVLLFVDGHKTHLTLQISRLCNSLGIVLIALYPNATRLLQPADVAAFKPLKTGWQRGILEWRRQHPLLQFTKENFAPLLSKVIENYVKSSTIVNGFKATGLFPWDRNAIDYSKCLGGANECIKNVAEERNALNTNNNNGNGTQTPVLDFKTFKSFLDDSLLKSLESGNETINNSDRNCLTKIWNFFNKHEEESSHQIETRDQNKAPNEKEVLLQVEAPDPVDDWSIYNIENMPMEIIETENVDDELCQALQEFDKNQMVFSSPSHRISEKIESSNEKQEIEMDFNIFINNTKPTTSVESSLSSVLHYPESPKRKNKRNVERQPYVITSKKWKNINEEKQNKKKIEEEEKERKRKVREENKMNKKNGVQKKKTKNKINIIQSIKISPILNEKTKYTLAGNKINYTELSGDESKENMELKSVRENDIKRAEERHTQQIISFQENEETKLKKAEEHEIKSAKENQLVQIETLQKKEDTILEKAGEIKIRSAEEKTVTKIESPQEQEDTKLEKKKIENDIGNEIKPAIENNLAKIESPQKEEKKDVSVHLEAKDKKKFLPKGICYACGESMSLNKWGRKCSRCTRTLHSQCTNKSFFSSVFVCNKCVGPKNIF